MESLASTKILIVEDDPLMREFMADWFEVEECIIETAEDGKEAIQIFEKFHPKLVFLDIKMPEMNGYEVLKWIKSQHPETKVIMITGDDSENTMEVCMNAGADSYIVKSVRIINLQEVVETILGTGEET